MTDTEWEDIYARGEQLNKHPFSEVVSFVFRNRQTLPPSGLSALDIGCGSGVHSAFLAENGYNVLGIDISLSAIEAARASHPDLPITFQKADFSTFEPRDRKFDLTVDRCSSTHSTVPTVIGLYQRLLGAMSPGAKLFWQGFSWDNSGRALGSDSGDGSWGSFSGGVFKPLGRTAFFTETDVRQIFNGFQILRLRHVSDTDVATGYDHSSWIVEAEYDG